MTKRDYERLARAFRHANNEVELIHNTPYRVLTGHEMREEVLRRTIGFVIIELKADNPRFNEDKFRSAIYD